MQILIVGGGKVGATLAAQLLREGHDITVIDRNEKVVTSLGNTLDVICLSGNGASYPLLVEAEAGKKDLVIAATASDEINMLCCLTAHKLGAQHTAARVRGPEYFDQLGFLKDVLGLTMIINPELAAAQEIDRMLRVPSAAKVELFAKGRAELVSCRVPKGSLLSGQKLMDFGRAKLNILICAVERGGEIFIPSGDFVIREGDTLSFTGAPHAMEAAFKKINLATERAHSVMIVGGGRITYYLSSLLAKEGVSVKIIEKDAARANELSALLEKPVVLQGDAADHELLIEEGLDKLDAFVALTGLDEGNILSALYASQRKVRKVIAKVNNDNLIPLVRETTLDSFVSPKSITANQILRYVRALSASHSDENIESLYKLADGRIEVLEFLAGPEGAYLNGTLSELPLKKGILIACIVRDGRALIPGGADSIRPRDSVLVVTHDRRLTKLSDILE